MSPSSSCTNVTRCFEIILPLVPFSQHNRSLTLFMHVLIAKSPDIIGKTGLPMAGFWGYGVQGVDLRAWELRASGTRLRAY